MAQSLPNDYYKSLQDNSRTLELIFSRYLITQSLYLESLASNSLTTDEKPILDVLQQYDVIDDFDQVFYSYLMASKQRAILFFRKELQCLDDMVKKRLENLNVASKKIDDLMSQEFWYSTQPEERFKGFERQKFSNTLSNKLRGFFYGNQGTGFKKQILENNLVEKNVQLGRRRSSDKLKIERF